MLFQNILNEFKNPYFTCITVTSAICSKDQCLSCKYLQQNHYKEWISFNTFIPLWMVQIVFHLNYLSHQVSELYQNL